MQSANALYFTIEFFTTPNITKIDTRRYELSLLTTKSIFAM